MQRGYYINLELGAYYSIQYRLPSGYLLVSDKVRFVKVTPKGFNFLDENTAKCIFPHHFYLSKKTEKY